MMTAVGTLAMWRSALMRFCGLIQGYSQPKWTKKSNADSRDRPQAKSDQKF